MLKQFVVRKYIMAESAQQAIKLENKFPVEDVWVDEDWKKNPNFTVEGFKAKK